MDNRNCDEGLRTFTQMAAEQKQWSHLEQLSRIQLYRELQKVAYWLGNLMMFATMVLIGATAGNFVYTVYGWVF